MKWLQNIIVKIAAKKVANSLELTEGAMDEKKQWWKSKGVLTGIVTVLIGTYETVKVVLAPQMGWNLPAIPPIAYTILGAVGIYARASATATLTK